MKIYNPTGFSSSLTGSFSGSVKGTFEGSFTGESLNNISGAFDSVSASLASDRLKNTTDTLDGDLTVTGTITAQEFHTEFVSASIVYESGSTQFGNSTDDTHIFTGTGSFDRIGIGTTDLSSSLISITGVGNPIGIGDEYGRTGIKFYGESSGLLQIFNARDNSTYGHIDFLTKDGTYNALRIENDGNIGIGVDTPSSRLHVDGGAVKVVLSSPDPFNTVQDSLIITNGAGNEGAGSRILFNVGSASPYIQSYVDGANSNSGAALSFATPASGTTGTERVRITSAGTLKALRGGNNTTGGTLMLGPLTNNTTKYAVLTGAMYNSDTEPEGYAMAAGISYDTGGGAIANILRIGGGIDEINTVNSLEFLTGGSDTRFGTRRMIIDGNGIVLIGTTSSTGAILSTGTRANMVIGAGTSSKIAFNNGSTTETGYVYNSTTETAIGYPPSGTFSIQRVGVDTIARINSNGNVGIGTTTPGAKLHVNGSQILNGDLTIPYSPSAVTNTIGIETSSTNPFSQTAKTLVIQGANAYQAGTPTQAQAGGDVYIKGGYGVVNTGLGVYAGDVYLEGGTTNAGTSTGAGNLIFKTTDTERLRITGTGTIQLPYAFVTGGLNSGAGVITDPGSYTGMRLYGQGDGNLKIFNVRNNSAYGNIIFYTGNGSSEALRIAHDGRVGVNTTSPSSGFQLTVNGWTLIKDRLYLNNLVPLGFVYRHDQLSIAGATVVSDTKASNGDALRKTSTDSGGTMWFGPYTTMPSGNYIAHFRLKVASNASSTRIITIDAIGGGVNGSLNISPNQFPASDRYTYFKVPFVVESPSNVVEMRGISYTPGLTDLYFDHILITPGVL